MCKEFCASERELLSRTPTLKTSMSCNFVQNGCITKEYLVLQLSTTLTASAIFKRIFPEIEYLHLSVE